MKVIQAFPEWATNNNYLFKKIAGYDSTALGTLIKKLDMVYFPNHSGKKIVSPLVESLVDSTTGKVSDANITILANIINGLYYDSWGKLYSAFFAEYNPIENYDMEETTTPGVVTTNKHFVNGSDTTSTDTNVTKTNTEKKDVTEEVTTEQNVVNTQKVNADSAVDSSIYGFDTTNPIKVGTQETKSDGDTNYTETSVVADADDNVVTTKTTADPLNNIVTETTVADGDDNKVTLERSYDGDENYDETSHSGYDTLERHGNIGVTTSQQMIESELELRKKSILDIIFANVDSVLACPIWEV